MDIVSALFAENIDLRPVPGPSTQHRPHRDHVLAAGPERAAGHRRPPPDRAGPLPARRGRPGHPRGRLPPTRTASRSPATCRPSTSSPASSPTGWCAASSSTPSTGPSRPAAACSPTASVVGRAPHPAAPRLIADAASPSALSTHPVTAARHRRGHRSVLERLGRHPDLAAIFVTRPHAGALEDAAAAVRRILAPSVLIGCAAESVVGPASRSSRRPAVTLWAGMVGPVAPIRLWTEVDADGPGRSDRRPPSSPFEPQALLLLVDPFTFAVDELLGRWPPIGPACRCSAGWRRRPRDPAATAWPSTAPCTPPARSAPSSARRCELTDRRLPGLPARRPSPRGHPGRAQLRLRARRPARPRAPPRDGQATACPNGTSAWSTRACTWAW